MNGFNMGKKVPMLNKLFVWKHLWFLRSIIVVRSLDNIRNINSLKSRFSVLLIFASMYIFSCNLLPEQVHLFPSFGIYYDHPKLPILTYIKFNYLGINPFMGRFVIFSQSISSNFWPLWGSNLAGQSPNLN